MPGRGAVAGGDLPGVAGGESAKSIAIRAHDQPLAGLGGDILRFVRNVIFVYREEPEVFCRSSQNRCHVEIAAGNIEGDKPACIQA